jgi:hypothetical protein
MIGIIPALIFSSTEDNALFYKIKVKIFNILLRKYLRRKIIKPVLGGLHRNPSIRRSVRNGSWIKLIIRELPAFKH